MKNKNIIKVALLISILGFILPFHNYSCTIVNDGGITVKGIDYIIAKTYNIEGLVVQVPTELQFIFILALFSILISLFLAFKNKIKWCLYSSIVGTIVMMIFYLFSPSIIRNYMNKLANGQPAYAITIRYLVGWYVSLLFILIAAVMSYIHIVNNNVNKATTNANIGAGGQSSKNCRNVKPLSKNMTYHKNKPKSSQNFEPDKSIAQSTSTTSIHKNNSIKTEARPAQINFPSQHKLLETKPNNSTSVIWTTSNGIISESHSIEMLTKACNKYNCNWKKMGSKVEKQLPNGKTIVYQEINFLNHRNGSISNALAKEIVENYYRNLYKIVLTGGR